MMKKILSVLALTSLIVSAGFAQDTDTRGNLKAGLKIGANYSNVYDSQNEEFQADPRLGLAAGAFLSIPLGTFLSFQPEIMYSQKGFLGTGKVLGVEYEYSRRTNFIDIPLLIAVSPIQNLTLVAGPQYSYLLKQTDSFKSPFLNTDLTNDLENEDINENIFCFIGGADLYINHVVLGVRLGWDITKNNGDGSSDVPRYKNTWYQATIGFSL